MSVSVSATGQYCTEAYWARLNSEKHGYLVYGMRPKWRYYYLLLFYNYLIYMLTHMHVVTYYSRVYSSLLLHVFIQSLTTQEGWPAFRYSHQRPSSYTHFPHTARLISCQPHYNLYGVLYSYLLLTLLWLDRRWNRNVRTVSWEGGDASRAWCG